MNEIIISLCPHCFSEFLVYESDINCGIFRHGVFIDNGEQIPPHLNKEMCDQLAKENKIIGCGKPFKIYKSDSGEFTVEICDYI
jgi:hypothetical protein